MRKLSILFAASLLATGCAATPAEKQFIEFIRQCSNASETQKQTWAYAQDLLIPLTGSDSVARLPDESPERVQLSEAHTQSLMQVIMVGMEMTRAGCPAALIGTPETLNEAYGDTGKTKPSWPSVNVPSDESKPVPAE